AAARASSSAPWYRPRRSRVFPRSRGGAAFPGAASGARARTTPGAPSAARAAHEAPQPDPSLRILRGHLRQRHKVEECQLRLSLGEIECSELPTGVSVLRLQLQDGAKLGAGLVRVTGLQGDQGPGRGQRGALL